jgi:hypothetical protein
MRRTFLPENLFSVDFKADFSLFERIFPVFEMFLPDSRG